MSKEERTSLQSELAAALAAGKSCAEWASANGVSERTAQRWANEPKVRAELETYRRGNLDHAVSRMSCRAVWATDQIRELAEKARSESVRLAALRSMLSDMMAVSDFARLEERLGKLEEQDRARPSRRRHHRRAPRRRPRRLSRGLGATAQPPRRPRWEGPEMSSLSPAAIFSGLQFFLQGLTAANVRTAKVVGSPFEAERF